MLVEVPSKGRLLVQNARLTVRPECRHWLDAHGLSSAGDILNLPGIVVSGHVGRNVSRVEIGGRNAYLKREHRIRWRDRFRSWHMGFGWSSVSTREAVVLRRLDDCGLPGPKWLAFGESLGQGFLLVDAAVTAVELLSLPSISDDLAEDLGGIIARIHAAGIDQPDLFAKHILVNPENGRFTILDWQRARLRRSIPLNDRIRTLASLRATAGESAFGTASWMRLLEKYQFAARRDGFAIPDLNVFSSQVESVQASLAQRPGIRSRALPAVAQELIRINCEVVCAIPSVADELKNENVIASLYDIGNDGSPMPLSGGRIGIIRVGHYSQTLSRWWAVVRGKNWRAPEVKAARLLFHLERHGINAPKLLAYGQVVPRMASARSFLLFETTKATRALTAIDRHNAYQLLGRLHEIGCHLHGPVDVDAPFGIEGTEAVVCDISGLRLVRHLSRRQIVRDTTRLDAFFAGAR